MLVGLSKVFHGAPIAVCFCEQEGEKRLWLWRNTPPCIVWSGKIWKFLGPSFRPTIKRINLVVDATFKGLSSGNYGQEAVSTEVKCKSELINFGWGDESFPRCCVVASIYMAEAEVKIILRTCPRRQIQIFLYYGGREVELDSLFVQGE